MKTNVRNAFRTTYVHSDHFDNREPHTNWLFRVGYNARSIAEGAGGESIEVDDLCVELLSATAWCGGRGADLRFDADYHAEVERWFRAKLDDPATGLREDVELSCRNHFEEIGGDATEYFDGEDQ